MQNLNLIDKLANWYIIILMDGFLFIGTIPKMIGGVEGALSVQYRIVVLGLAISFVFFTLVSKRVRLITISPLYVFIVFWILYSFRILHDLFIVPIKLFPESSPSQYMQFAFGVVLLPSISLLYVIQGYRINLQWILRWTYRILLITLLLSLYYRSGSDLEGRTAGDVNVGILSFGQYGASLAILSIYNLAIRKFNIKKGWFYIFGLLIGLAAIFVSASKSPFLALLLVQLVFVLLWYGSVKSAFIIGVVGVLISYYFIEFLSFFSYFFDSNFSDRLLYAIEMGGDRTRENLLGTAFEEFIESPLLGNAILIQNESMAGSYPHNFIVESFMAVGIFGGIIFLAWIVKCLKLVVKALKTHSEISWIALLFLQYLTFAMFSGNIYSGNMFWMFSVLLVVLSYKHVRGSHAIVEKREDTSLFN